MKKQNRKALEKSKGATGPVVPTRGLTLAPPQLSALEAKAISRAPAALQAHFKGLNGTARVNALNEIQQQNALTDKLKNAGYSTVMCAW